MVEVPKRLKVIPDPPPMFKSEAEAVPDISILFEKVAPLVKVHNPVIVSLKALLAGPDVQLRRTKASEAVLDSENWLVSKEMEPK